MNTASRNCLIDGSMLLTEALKQSGADAFVGYPITPANLIYYYSSQLFEVMLPAPDEISTLQWMCGLSAAGKLPFTATSYPGFALMSESINMAYMMELPMVIVLAQRLGPATGTATCNAEGDIDVVHGLISGGYPIPVVCPSHLMDCWELAHTAVQWAYTMKTPVILLTEKEMVMTYSDFDLAALRPLTPVPQPAYSDTDSYQPYSAQADLTRVFLPVGHDRHQVRLTASTHNMNGILAHTTPEALQNSRRLNDKLIQNLDAYTCYDYDQSAAARTLLLAYGQSAKAARAAVNAQRNNHHPVDLLTVKTLFPIPPVYFEIAARYDRIVVVEENLLGSYRKLLFGARPDSRILGVNTIGQLITPDDILEVLSR